MDETKTFILLYDMSKSENKFFKKDNNNHWKIGKITSSHESWLKTFEYKNKCASWPKSRKYRINEKLLLHVLPISAIFICMNFFIFS